VTEHADGRADAVGRRAHLTGTLLGLLQGRHFPPDVRKLRGGPAVEVLSRDSDLQCGLLLAEHRRPLGKGIDRVPELRGPLLGGTARAFRSTVPISASWFWIPVIACCAFTDHDLLVKAS
jgi:hypothetical protein